MTTTGSPRKEALLLDRLVRQGRAFGIHVLLGSQTLGGAYSLARSTIGQMAVRIALQCSKADAHLILSEENTAARLLTRPGKAIYNDANGVYEGNHPFQVVWLPDDERDRCLQQIAEHAARQRLFGGENGRLRGQRPLRSERKPAIARSARGGELAGSRPGQGVVRLRRGDRRARPPRSFSGRRATISSWPDIARRRPWA